MGKSIQSGDRFIPFHKPEARVICDSVHCRLNRLTVSWSDKCVQIIIYQQLQSLHSFHCRRGLNYCNPNAEYGSRDRAPLHYRTAYLRKFAISEKGQNSSTTRSSFEKRWHETERNKNKFPDGIFSMWTNCDNLSKETILLLSFIINVLTSCVWHSKLR